MTKQVRIQSTVTITVTPGLHHKDVTNKDAHIPDRLKVSPLWPKATVMIRQGANYYPAEIVEWPTVKALEKDGILTIGQIEEANGDVVDEAKNLDAELTAIENEATSGRKRKSDKPETLADIASEG